MSSEGATGNSVIRNINERMIIAQRAAIELLFSCPSVSASFEMENMANIYVIKEAVYKIAKQGIFFLISPLQAIVMQRISIINPVIRMVNNFLFILMKYFWWYSNFKVATKALRHQSFSLGFVVKKIHRRLNLVFLQITQPQRLQYRNSSLPRQTSKRTGN